MGSSQERKVGQRGQVTLPKELREKLDINRGDNAIIHDEKEKSLSRSQSVGKELAVGIDSAQPNPEPSKRRWLTCLARAINISAMGRIGNR